MPRSLLEPLLEACVDDVPLHTSLQGGPCADLPPASPEAVPHPSMVNRLLDKIMLSAPKEQVERLHAKLERMEKEEPEEMKIKECLKHLKSVECVRLIDCLAISHILNDEKILIASKVVDENIDAYWERLTNELSNDLTKSVDLLEK